MRFASPEYFYWLLVIPLVAAGGAAALWRRLHQARQLADRRLFARLAPEFSREREIVRLVLLVLAVAALVVALARPQFGTYTRLVKRRGVDVVVALDLSRSMLARDVSARRTGNRLQRAKLEISGLIDRLRGDRIGLVAFAGSAFVQCPLTSDYAAAKLFMRAMEVGVMPQGGTNFAAALQVARQLFTGAKGGSRSRVLVVISDGEDHDSDWQEELDKLKTAGVVIHCIGVGTKIGELIPQDNGGYLHYHDKTVMTRLREKTLRALATAGGGLYLHSVAGDLGFEAIYDRLEHMQKADYESRLESVYEDRFQVFVFLALLLLVAATSIPARREVNREEEA